MGWPGRAQRAIRWKKRRQRHGENLPYIAIEEMLGTVEEAMCQVIDWWGDLPSPMKEAIEQFRTQLGGGN